MAHTRDQRRAWLDKMAKEAEALGISRRQHIVNLRAAKRGNKSPEQATEKSERPRGHLGRSLFGHKPTWGGIGARASLAEASKAKSLSPEERAKRERDRRRRDKERVRLRDAAERLNPGAAERADAFYEDECQRIPLDEPCEKCKRPIALPAETNGLCLWCETGARRAG